MNYIEECDKTASPVFNPENVDYLEFVQALDNFARMAEVLNLYKKALFRGKTAEELGLRVALDVQSLEGNANVDTIADLVHGAIGIATEAGELVDMLLGVIRDDKRPDRVNAVEECGDIMWYQSRVLKWAGVSFEHCQSVNIAKLHGRHGETFSFARDHYRRLDKEREGLEASLPMNLEKPQ